MSVQPPSGPPAGPPSGPLSGGEATPPAPPPPAPPGGGGGGPAGPAGAGPGGTGPWWRSVPRIAAITAVVVAAAALVVVLTRFGGTGDTGTDVYLQAASATGPDPFTRSTAKVAETPQPRAKLPASTASPSPVGGTNVTRGVDGATPGLYGGTERTASCDTEQQIRFLADEPDRNRAFASALGLAPAAVPAYLRSLTPVTLRMDTRVTNHGFTDGAARPYQAVLQTGTAVLVDDRGVPRVRCACGNPLLPPVFVRGPAERKGDAWPGYNPAETVAVTPAPRPVEAFVVYDPRERDYFAREQGDDGEKDKPAAPPRDPSTPVLVPPEEATAAPSDEETSGRPERESPAPGTTSPPGPATDGSATPGQRSPGEETSPGRPAEGTTGGEPPTGPPTGPVSEEPPAPPPAGTREPAPESPPPTSGPAPREEEPVPPSLPDLVVPPAGTASSPAPAP
ncbi:hypothetical protein QRN89_27400 [Streptomyces chengbuensis]|uniref:DUF6777 domain-containing protein n=1 Tax=Streptomyces TaxID=1883 RepID=UPI0025B3032C|nr:DUF6777 domain-containing protein [Streptomyces sp. HUAS CB01]WJY53207.1 hypothetical protein QRN89_27400 [Streptomyces sp. HUAS CB01]